MKLTVIIPCKNEVGTVEHLLDSLVKQTTQPDEVIVIDSHSSDTTADTARSYSDRLPIKVVTAQKRGLAHARNEGVQAASGDMLLFTDADVQLPSHFIQTMRHQIETRHLDIGGFSQRMPEGNWSLKFGARMMNGYVRTMSVSPWPIFFSCFFASKKVHDTLGGFDANLWIMEDYDYAYRAKKSGAKFGLIHGTHFIASARRFEEKGTGTNISRALYAEFYRYTHGMRLTKPLFKYEMGGKAPTPPDQKSKANHK